MTAHNLDWLLAAGFFLYAGIRTLRSPERQAAIRFRPWTYRRVDYRPEPRDIRNAKILGVFLVAVAVVALLFFAIGLR